MNEEQYMCDLRSESLFFLSLCVAAQQHNVARRRRFCGFFSRKSTASHIKQSRATVQPKRFRSILTGTVLLATRDAH